MTPWILLLLTFGCAYMTYDAFRWSRDISRAPFSVIAHLWKGGQSHMSLTERAEVQRRYSSRSIGAGEMCWVFVLLTLTLAVATVRAFVG